MNWFLYALAAPIIWAAINHVDKYVISRYAENKKPEALVIFSALASGLLALIIIFFVPIEHISLMQSLWAMFAGVLFISSYIPYIYALQADEVSVVAPLWQMIAPLSYIAGVIFFHEILSGHQIFAGILIVSGAVLMTLNLENLVWKRKVFNLMLLACLLITINTIIFKTIGLESSFWTATFWEAIGAFIFGLILLSISACRRDFKSFVREGGRRIVSLNVLAESLNVMARLFFNFAILLGPIALVNVINGTQPFFIFIYGLFLFVFFPNFHSENYSRKTFLLKLSAILIMIIGSVILFL